MSDIQLETVAQREVVMTVLTHVKKGEIQEATACFAESFQFNDWGIGLEFSNRIAEWEFRRRTQLLRVVSFRFVGNPESDRLPVAGSISEWRVNGAR